MVERSLLAPFSLSFKNVPAPFESSDRIAEQTSRVTIENTGFCPKLTPGVSFQVEVEYLLFHLQFGARG